MKSSPILAVWLLLPLPSSRLTESLTPLDLGSAVLADGGTVTFLSPNNSRLLAHQGSEVTWTRRTKRLDTGERSLQLLSVGDNTYISDTRFIISNKKVDNNWELTISRVELSDGGEYLCQATTHPPLAIITILDVVDAYSEIQVENEAENGRGKKMEHLEEKDINQKEIFIKKGSKLKLKCLLKKATEKPEFIFWYHNETMINYSPHTGKIVTLEESGFQSVLIIKSVGSEDAGLYRCCPHNIIPDTVTINIMDSDGNFAAVYKDSVSSQTSSVMISDINLLGLLLVLRAVMN